MTKSTSFQVFKFEFSLSLIILLTRESTAFSLGLRYSTIIWNTSEGSCRKGMNIRMWHCLTGSANGFTPMLAAMLFFFSCIIAVDWSLKQTQYHPYLGVHLHHWLDLVFFSTSWNACYKLHLTSKTAPHEAASLTILKTSEWNYYQYLESMAAVSNEQPKRVAIIGGGLVRRNNHKRLDHMMY